jgi:hypothetical protein
MTGKALAGTRKSLFFSISLLSVRLRRFVAIKGARAGINPAASIGASFEQEEILSPPAPREFRGGRKKNVN